MASRFSEDARRSASSSGVSSKVSGATAQPCSAKKLHSPSRRITKEPSPMTCGDIRPVNLHYIQFFGFVSLDVKP